MGAQFHGAGHEVDFAVVDQLPQLPLHPVDEFQDPARDPARNAVRDPDDGGFALHVAGHAHVRGLTMVVIAVVNNPRLEVPHPAAHAAQTQNEIVIAAVHVLVIAVKPNAVVNGAAHKEGLVVDVQDAGVTEHIVIVGNLVAGVDQLPLAVHKGKITEDRVPFGMFREGAAHLVQDAGGETIVGIQNANHLPGGHANALVHGVVVALVFFGDPLQMRIRSHQVHGSIGGPPVHDEVLQTRIILAEYALDGFPDGVDAVEGRRDNGDQGQLGHGKTPGDGLGNSPPSLQHPPPAVKL